MATSNGDFNLTPQVDPGFSRRAARDPTIQSYPEPERVREQGYPEMFTTETDLAAPAEDRPETPLPPPPPIPLDEQDLLPHVEGAALKCGRNPRRGNPPPRPYARAQFAVVAHDPESPPDSPQHRVPTPGPALANAYSSFQVGVTSSSSQSAGWKTSRGMIVELMTILFRQ